MSLSVDNDKPKTKPSLFWPSEWPKPEWRGWLSVVLLVLVSVMNIWIGIYIGRGFGLVTYLYIATAQMFLALAYFNLYQQNIVRRSGISNIKYREIPAWRTRGIALPYSATLAWVLLVSVHVLPILWIPYALFLLVNMLGLVLIIIPLVVIFAGVWGYSIWGLVDTFLRRLRRGFVALTPEGVYLQSWGMQSFVAWKDVLAIQPIAFPVGTKRFSSIYVNALPSETSWFKRTSWTSKQYEMSAAPSIVIFGFNLAVNPVLVLRAINFYYFNESARHELDSPAGVTRIREIGQQIGLG